MHIALLLWVWLNLCRLQHYRWVCYQDMTLVWLDIALVFRSRRSRSHRQAYVLPLFLYFLTVSVRPIISSCVGVRILLWNVHLSTSSIVSVSSKIAVFYITLYKVKHRSLYKVGGTTEKFFSRCFVLENSKWTHTYKLFPMPLDLGLTHDSWLGFILCLLLAANLQQCYFFVFIYCRCCVSGSWVVDEEGFCWSKICKFCCLLHFFPLFITRQQQTSSSAWTTFHHAI